MEKEKKEGTMKMKGWAVKMNVTRNKFKEVNDWIKKANEDLNDAFRLFKRKGNVRNILFLLQQAIEKYLKAYLEFRGFSVKSELDLDILYTHKIKDLRDACCEFDDDFKDLIDDDKAEVLTYFATSGRYPNGRPPTFSILSRAELPEFFEISKKLRDFVLQKLEIKEEVAEKLEKDETEVDSALSSRNEIQGGE
ncbi:MAG: HEPN domain-containing protein [bacterium JZ-2024 1]